MIPNWLVDAGPLIALIRRNDNDHAACVKVAAALRGPLGTTWPALTEAIHVLGTIKEQDAVLDMVEKGALSILPLDAADVPRLRVLMRKYSAQPMDVADATLVRVAEREGISQIFTLDRDFRIYRIGRNRPFTIVP
jgi:predicted nucleic acid-binding protein